MQLHYKTLGSGSPIIIVHGLFGSADNWLSIAKVLSQQHEVFLVDMRNHGRSPRHDEFNYDAMSADLQEFIQHQNIKNPVLLGHSMGGKVVMHYACRYYPENYSKLIVVDIAPKHYRRHHDTILEGLLSIDLEQIKTRQEADDQLAKFVPEMDVRMFLLKNLYRNDEGKFDWRINLPVINTQIENVGEALPRDFYSQKPTLFIKGANSGYIKEDDTDLIKEHFPNAELEVIAGAGHWIHAEKPAEFLEIIQNFINKP